MFLELAYTERDLDQIISTVIAAAVPTLAVIAAFVRNETAMAQVNARIDTLTRDMNSRFEAVDSRFESMNARFETMNARFETLTRDFNLRIETLTRDMNYRFETLTRDMNARFETLTRRVDSVNGDMKDWSKITMEHHTEIARLKDKAGLPN
jgi:DNA anti-recombination protein RmuC